MIIDHKSRVPQVPPLGPGIATTPEGTLIYTYDAAGNLASIASSNANGASMSYVYDSQNRLSTVTDKLGTTTYTYDGANNVYTVKYPSTVLGTYMYDQLNRVTGLGYSNQPNSYVYTRGSTGNLTSATEPSGRQVAWSFDGIYRLQTETISGTQQNNGSVSYTLDPVGNRTSDTSSLAGVPSGSWNYNSDDELSSETYDQDGNVTAADGKTFSYDSQNEMLSMNGGAVQMVYDGDGNRVRKTANGVTTEYLVDDLNPTGLPQVMDELTNGVVTRAYTYGLQRVSEDQFVNNAWTPSFYSYDGMGSVRQLTNTAGTVTDSYEYDAFGNQITHTGSTPNNYLYRGEHWDPDLGLYYLRARFYNPMLDRFVSRDPNDGHLTDPITLHKYLYADGDPVNGSDPTGRAVAINYRIGIAIGLGATAGVIAFRNAVNCKYNWNATDFSANVTAGAFGSTWQTGPCSWEGSPPTVYPLPFPFPISTPAPWGPYGQPGSCDSGAGEEWHHLVPQAERPWAEGCGFNIDQPGLGMCIKGSCHDQIHGNSNGTNWNAAWQYQIDNVWGRDQCPSVQQLVSFAQSLAVQFADDIMCQ